MFLCNKNMTFYVHFMYVVLIFYFWTFYYIKHVLFIFHSCKNAFLPQLIFDRIVLRTMAASHGCVAAYTFLHQIHFCIKCIFASGTIFALQSMALRTIAAGHGATRNCGFATMRPSDDCVAEHFPLENVTNILLHSHHGYILHSKML